MSVYTKGRRFIVLMGSTFLMLATVTSTKVTVDVDVNVNMIGQEYVCRNEIITDLQGKLMETCKSCSTNLPNGTLLTHKAQTSATSVAHTRNIRIPTDLYPVNYEVELFPNMTDPDPKKFTFTGKVKINMTCRKSTHRLTLHTKNLTIDSISFIEPTKEGYTPESIQDTARDFLILNLKTPTKKNNHYLVEINFNAPLTNEVKGLYYSKYVTDDKPVYLTTSYLFPHHARMVFPCFDEPAIKAYFDITLVRPSNYVSLSNMPVKSETPIQINGINYVKDTFEKTKKMSTYLLAFVVCNFAKIENKRNKGKGKPIRVWSRPDAIDQTKYALEIGMKTLPYFEKYFNFTYPLPKLDIIAVPDFDLNGMENWGAIIIKEANMLTELKSNPTTAQVVSHEVAHQWFGDLVSPAWWDDLWLNEGFASFAQYLGVDFCHPEWNVFESFVRTDVLAALSADSYISSHPIYISVANPSKLSYGPIIYKKSAAVIRMMRHFIGFETFKKGLHKYLTNHRYNVATKDKLWSTLTEQWKNDTKEKSLNVKKIMDSWILQKNYPLVTVTRDNSGNSYNGALRVRQQRFLLNPDASELGQSDSTSNYMWDIPLTFASNHTRNFKETDLTIYWLQKHETNKMINASQLLPTRNTWFICNINMNGYYRVNYDRSNWLALAKQLKEDHKVIPVTNRVQIISDAFTLARANILPYEIAFNITEYLEHERHYLVWQQVLDDFGYIGNMLSSSPIYGLFQNFTRKRISVVYKDLIEKKKSDKLAQSENELYKSLLKAACQYEIQDCVDDAVAQFKRWMGNPKNNMVETDSQDVVYCKAISEGGEKEWEFLFEMYKADTSLLFRAIDNLVCTKKPWLLNRLLQMSILENSPFPLNEALYIPLWASQYTIGRSVTWEFFRASFDKVNSIHGASKIWSYVIDHVTKSLNTEIQLNELKDFKLEHGDLGPGEVPIQQAIQKVEANVQWMKTHYNTVEAWLKANVN